MLNAVTPSWRWILLLAIGVLCTMVNTADVHRPVMSQEDLDLLRTDGRPDTKIEGEAAAKRDIARNARRYMTHGLGLRLPQVLLRRFEVFVLAGQKQLYK